MKLVVKTYLLQVRRKLKTYLEKHLLMAGVISLAITLLLITSALILKEMLLPVLEVINQIEEVSELQSIMSSLALSSSAIVALLYMIRIIVSDQEDDAYIKMLENYKVPLLIRHGLSYLVNSTYLISMGLILASLIFLPSVVELKVHRTLLASLVILQVIWSSLLLETSLIFIHTICRHILKRWVSMVFILCVFYYSYQHVLVPQPLTLFAYITKPNFILWFLLCLKFLILITIYTLSFKGYNKKGRQSLLLFSFLSSNIYLKHLKETIRLKDFWFNSILIFAIILGIMKLKPELLKDSMVLQILILLPSMQSIYSYSQIKDSLLIYRMTQTPFYKIYLSTWISSSLTYIFQMMLIYILVEDSPRVFMDQLPLLLLCLSGFKLMGLYFPLNYKSSKNEQIIISSLSLLLLPIVLISLELKKLFSLELIHIKIIFMVLVVSVNCLEMFKLRGMTDDPKT